MKKLIDYVYEELLNTSKFVWEQGELIQFFKEKFQTPSGRGIFLIERLVNNNKLHYLKEYQLYILQVQIPIQMLRLSWFINYDKYYRWKQLMNKAITLQIQKKFKRRYK